MEEQTEFLPNGFNPKEGNCDKEFNKKPQDTREETTSCPVTPKRAALLNAILGSAQSETSLLPHLKGIPEQCITVFLQYLGFLYLKWSENAANTTPPGLHPPAQSQIVALRGLLLEADFAVVVTIPEAKRLLFSLYKFVKSQICI